MRQITIEKDILNRPMAADVQASFCRSLEEGSILFFSKIPFYFPPEDIAFLLAQKQSSAGFHKNISYRPQQKKITGMADLDKADQGRLLAVMEKYSQGVVDCVGKLMGPYSERWKLDYASFRPQQEKGRKLRVKARNDLLHIDSFPTRPTGGNRILRFFTNINPEEARRWVTTDPFDVLLPLHTGPSRMPLPTEPSALSGLKRKLAGFAAGAGLPVVDRSPYDAFMLGFHDYLKQNEEFQANTPKYQWDFPPGSCWMVYTDFVPHAALSGRFALEQTLIIDKATLLLPDKAPVNILQKLCGYGLTG